MTANTSSGLASVGRRSSSKPSKADKASNISQIKLKVKVKLGKRGSK